MNPTIKIFALGRAGTVFIRVIDIQHITSTHNLSRGIKLVKYVYNVHLIPEDRVIYDTVGRIAVPPTANGHER